MLMVKCHSLKWPNIEQMNFPFGHTFAFILSIFKNRKFVLSSMKNYERKRTSLMCEMYQRVQNSKNDIHLKYFTQKVRTLGQLKVHTQNDVAFSLCELALNWPKHLFIILNVSLLTWWSNFPYLS